MLQDPQVLRSFHVVARANRRRLLDRMLAAISIRQNFPLLIYKANFGDSKYARLQRLSTSIDRFSASATKHHCPFRGVKRPSARLRYA
jgi:hypothetical protein